MHYPEAHYKHVGELARVATSKLPGMIPIMNQWNGINSRAATQTGEVPGFNQIIPMGFIYSAKQPGTVGLLRFRKDRTYRLALEFNRNYVESLGYIYDDTLGYVF